MRGIVLLVGDGVVWWKFVVGSDSKTLPQKRGSSQKPSGVTCSRSGKENACAGSGGTYLLRLSEAFNPNLSSHSITTRLRNSVTMQELQNGNYQFRAL